MTIMTLVTVVCRRILDGARGAARPADLPRVRTRPPTLLPGPYSRRHRKGIAQRAVAPSGRGFRLTAAELVGLEKAIARSVESGKIRCSDSLNKPCVVRIFRCVIIVSLTTEGGDTLTERLFPLPQKTLKKEKPTPSDVVVFDYHEGVVVVLAQISTENKGAARPAFLRHVPGRVPHLEAIAFARHLRDKARKSGVVLA